VYHVWNILREVLGHNFVSGLRTLKPKKNKKKPKNLKKILKNLGFFHLRVSTEMGLYAGFI